MKRVGKLIIGGIQSKIFNLILFTILLMSLANAAVYLYHSHMMTRLAEDYGGQQQTAIGQLTGSVMDEVVANLLERSNKTEAKIVDKLFNAAAVRVDFMADYVERLVADPQAYPRKTCKAPDPDGDGTWSAMAIYADGVDPSDPAVADKIGLMANLADVLISMCPSVGAANAYIALPEGVHISVSDNPGSWYEDGKLKSYDPRERGWYKEAAEAGQRIFTEGEYDANTGVYCVECAAPVYGPDGNIAAVVGTDLYLDEMLRVMRGSYVDGEYQLLVSHNGKAVLTLQEAAFPLSEEDTGKDLRESSLPLLAQTVKAAVRGSSVVASKGQLSDGGYYITAAPVATTGWALVSAFSQEMAGQPVTLLQEQSGQLQSEMSNVYLEKTEKSKVTALVLLGVILLLTLGGALILGKRIVKPLNTITRQISRLNGSNLEFKMEDAYRTGDEVEELAKSFASISHKTVEYMETVKRVTAEKERIGTELSLATKIQASMMPHIFPAFPDRDEFDIYAAMDPAREVGGDFYDYFLVDDDHLCMVMADVSGKGVPAALFMMASKIILQSYAMQGETPAQILTKMNEAICSNNQEEMFVTVWVGILEISTGRLTAANAGHEYPTLRHADGQFELFKDRHGFVVGGMPGVRYREYELQLEPGAKMFLYTDGVPEATDPDQNLFGTERMLAALNISPEAAPEEILKNIRMAVDGFVKDAEQFDDLTMLCVEYKGEQK